MRVRSKAEKRLVEVRSEVAALREELRALDEQVAYTAELAGDAETRALVSDAPLADRELAEAGDDHRRTRRQRDEARARVDALLAEQDDLLDRLAARMAEGTS